MTNDLLASRARIDLALAFAVVRAMADPPSFFAGIARVLRPGGRCLVAEPKGHVAVPGGSLAEGRGES